MSRSSVASAEKHDPRHIELLRLAGSVGKAPQIRELLETPGSEWYTEKDKDALRQALQKAAPLGDESLALYLIQKGADVNVKKVEQQLSESGRRPETGTSRLASPSRRDERIVEAENRLEVDTAASARTSRAQKATEISALIRAAERGRPALVKLLLEHGADTEARDGNGRTALFPSALKAYVGVEIQRKQRKGVQDKRPKTIEEIEKEKADEVLKKAAIRKEYLDVVKLLLAAKADINAQDKDERTPLLYIASEKGESVEQDVVELLLQSGADVEALDQTEQRRSALQWAAATGKMKLATVLLSGAYGMRADVNASNDRGRRALHFAAEHGQDSMVRLLLASDADARAESTGGWTALHNAAQLGRTSAVSILLEPNRSVNVNAKLYNGMTALHWAAYNGHEDVVKLIVTHKDANLTIKDSFDRTPMLCAAEKDHSAVVEILSPGRNGARLHEKARLACKDFEATVVDFGMNLREGRQRRFRHNVFELLYGWDAESNKPRVTTAVKNVPHKPAFRWIHLPANNVAWVEALLAKSFIEQGYKDIDDFKAIEKCFSQEHRGPTVHAHFMRTFCHKIKLASEEHSENPTAPSSQQHRPSLTMTQADNIVESQLPTIVEPPSAASPHANGTPVSTPKRASIPIDTDAKDSTPISPTTEERKKTKSEKRADRYVENHLKKPKRQGTGPQPARTNNKVSTDPRRSQGQRQASGKVITKMSGGSGKIVLFMPFLHYETDERRQRMAGAIKRFRLENLGNTSKRIATDEDRQLPKPDGPMTRDDLLIGAYLNSPPHLHPRRTLDQYFYHGIDTAARDQDQVVYRYCKRRGLERKIFMVDQLWMYILGNDLIVTAFPQRWQQPKNDPLNVLEGIIEDTNAKTRPPVKSVYDLAMLITTRCSGMFDRHLPDKEEFQFLDMFESSIGRVTNRETELFDRFNRDSKKAAQWLKEQSGTRGGRRVIASSGRGDGLTDPRFQDDLLDIGTETQLLAEIKDIRDEIQMIKSVLTFQLSILPEMSDRIKDEIQGGPKEKKTDEWWEVDRRKDEQRKMLETHLADLKRMDEQASLIYISLTNLLDLKQKHANAFEARFARDQASLTARQGQTIMVFTIVTIVFLPMSFIAAFFAINFVNFQHNGVSVLTIGYVSKYMFGIGLAISVPLIVFAFAVDDVTALIRKSRHRLGGGLSGRKEQKPKEPEKQDEVEDSDLDVIHEKISRISISSGLHGDQRDDRRPRSKNYDSVAERDFSPLARTTSGLSNTSWRRSYERRRIVKAGEEAV